jgi:hypothetical protein
LAGLSFTDIKLEMEFLNWYIFQLFDIIFFDCLVKECILLYKAAACGIIDEVELDDFQVFD